MQSAATVTEPSQQRPSRERSFFAGKHPVGHSPRSGVPHSVWRAEPGKGAPLPDGKELRAWRYFERHAMPRDGNGDPAAGATCAVSLGELARAIGCTKRWAHELVKKLAARDYIRPWALRRKVESGSSRRARTVYQVRRYAEVVDAWREKARTGEYAMSIDPITGNARWWITGRSTAFMTPAEFQAWPMADYIAWDAEMRSARERRQDERAANKAIAAAEPPPMAPLAETAARASAVPTVVWEQLKRFVKFPNREEAARLVVAAREREPAISDELIAEYIGIVCSRKRSGEISNVPYVRAAMLNEFTSDPPRAHRPQPDRSDVSARLYEFSRADELDRVQVVIEQERGARHYEDVAAGRAAPTKEERRLEEDSGVQLDWAACARTFREQLAEMYRLLSLSEREAITAERARNIATRSAAFDARPGG